MACDCLWDASSTLMHFVNVSMRACLSLSLCEAAAINSTLTTHLCASYIEMGDTDGSLFSLK